MASQDTALVKVDTEAGSQSYNQLDMQVSQSLHMGKRDYREI